MNYKYLFNYLFVLFNLYTFKKKTIEDLNMLFARKRLHYISLSCKFIDFYFILYCLYYYNYLINKTWKKYPQYH